jgi:hypothetical protein
MSSPEREISTVRPVGGVGQPSGMEVRIASLENEATRLRAEIAQLQDKIRWLTGDEEEWSGDVAWLSRGWLYRGWVQASLVLLVVGLVTLASVPYFLHLLDPSNRPLDRIPVSAEPLPAAPAARSTAPAAPASVAAPMAVPAQEYIRAPALGRSTEIPEPTDVLSPEERPDHPAPTQFQREPRITSTPGIEQPASTPVRAESP